MAHLCGLNSNTLLQSPMLAALWETFVFAELRKQLSFRGQRSGLWYYRDQSQLEVDFILESGDQLELIECKWTASPTAELARNMNNLERHFLERSTIHHVVAKKLVTRAEITFVRQGLTYASPLKGMLQ